MNKQESRYRWIVFSTLLFAFFLIINQRTAPGLITNQLMKDFHVSAATIGLMTSVQFFAYAGLQFPMGLLSDRYGPNRFLIIGTLIDGLGNILFSLAPNEHVLIFSRFLVGIGDAMIWINLVSILSRWFKSNEFVKLLGIAGMVASLGSLSATVPLSLWISFAGWKVPFFSISIMLVAISYLLYIVLVSKPKKLFKENSVENEHSVKERKSFISTLKEIITTRQAWATFLCHFGIVGTYIGFIGSWGVPYGMHVFELTRSEASALIMYGLFGSMIGSPIVSWITSKLGSIKKIYITIYLLFILGWVILFLSGLKPSFTLVVILFFMIGFAQGGSNLTFAIIRNSFPAEKVGSISGFSNTGGFLSAVLLPILFGNILDLFPQRLAAEGYHYGFMIPILFSLIGLIGISLVKEKKNV